MGLSPIILLFALFLLGGDRSTSSQVAVTIGGEALCVAVLAGFWLPTPYNRWGFRCFAGMIFLAYSAYLIDEFFFQPHPFGFWGNPKVINGGGSPLLSLLGFIVIGLPSLFYLIRGSFTKPHGNDPGPK